jgi:LL-diaminopimelate aminotransferase
MKINPNFIHWDKPYLFQELEDTYNNLPLERRKRVIPLAIGDPDLPTPSGIREAMCKAYHDRYFGYPSVEGRRDLREAISEYYDKRFSVDVHPDDVLIGPGAKTDLFDLCAVFARPGNLGAVLDPAYPVYCDSLLFRGMEILFMTGTAENSYMPELNMKKADEKRLAMIFMCYPNNPTGVPATRTYVKTMVDKALEYDAAIVYDSAYADFVPGGGFSQAFSIFSIEGADQCAIEVGSFSKPFSMTGDRISWVVIKNPEMRKLWRRYRSNRDSGVSEYVQLGALAALTDPSVTRDVAQNMKIYGRRADILLRGFKAMELKVMGLTNSPYAWFSSPMPDCTESARLILEQALVQVTPGVGFGPAGEGYLRATVFQPAEKLEEAIDRLNRISFS